MSAAIGSRVGDTFGGVGGPYRPVGRQNEDWAPCVEYHHQARNDPKGDDGLSIQQESNRVETLIGTTSTPRRLKKLVEMSGAADLASYMTRGLLCMLVSGHHC